MERFAYRGAAVGCASVSARVTIDGAHLAVLHPTATFHLLTKRRGNREAAGENNRSLVLKLTYGAISFLFTGDAMGHGWEEHRRPAEGGFDPE